MILHLNESKYFTAVPRPLRLERILSVISCIGVGNLVLIGASKVQNDYFGSHLFRRPEEMKKCLVEGSGTLYMHQLIRCSYQKYLSSLFLAYANK
jgi:hypothetical protein